MSYTVWAVRLTQHFFGPQFAKQRVRLMVTRDVLDHTFPDIGGTNAFIDAVRKSGPEWLVGHENLHDRGLKLHNQWKRNPENRSRDYPKKLVALKDAPPFLPYLCLLCLAWTEEGQQLQPHDFFGRLVRFYPNHGLEDHLSDWRPLWDGLEAWTELHKKKWGHFVTEQLGLMPHVGIPKSQVILTPCKVDNLPELFTACSLQPAELTPERIGAVFRAHAGAARAFLGNSVFEAIDRNTPLGQSALVLLGEYLENWDGVPPRKPTEPGAGPVNQSSQSISLVISLHDEGRRWTLSFGLRDFREARGLKFPVKGWAFATVSPGLLILRNDQGQDVTPAEIAPDWTEGASLNANWHAELADADPLRLILPRERGVRVFEQAWVNQRLVEGATLPTSGGIYVLVGPDNESRWQNWHRQHVAPESLVDYTLDGLPAGHKLWRLEYLEKLSAAARIQFPSSQDLPNTRPRALRLVGGTRARSNAARRIYARYDPPILAMCAAPGATLTVEGATHHPLPSGSKPAGLPGEAEQRFTLELQPQISVVIATAQLDGETIGTAVFGILPEDADATPLEPQRFSVNRFGEVGSDSVVQGAVTPAAEGGSPFYEGTLPLGSPMAPDSTDHPAFDLLESLAIDHHGGRVPIPEFRRRAEEITRVAPWRLYLEARWLCHLGHIEIQTDSWGRWSYIHQNPPHFYCLPWKFSGIYYGVLAGCGTRLARKEAIRLAADLDCKVFVRDNACKLVPPRILFAHPELEVFEMLANELKMGWGSQPAALHLSRWAAGLDEWRDHMVWHPDCGPAEVAEYVPSRFQVTAAEHYSAPFRLQSVEDPYTRRHRWHKLVHNDAIGNNGLRHAFVRDAAWGMWKAQNAIADEDLTILPFVSTNQELVVPFTLEFPYLLARALALCSGLVPKQVMNHSAYATRTAGVVPDDSPLYAGECWAYGPVPQSIAEIVATKVLATLKVIDHSPHFP